jgi:hypothetical protein
MALNVKTSIYPFRVSLKDKAEWDFRMEITNLEQKPSRVLLEIDLPQETTFTKASYSQRYETKYEAMKPGETVSLKLPIFVSKHGDVGEFNGRVRVTEHYGEYGYVTKGYSRDILLKIVP